MSLAKKLQNSGYLPKKYTPMDSIDIFSIVELRHVEEVINNDGEITIFFSPPATVWLSRVNQFVKVLNSKETLEIYEKEYTFLGYLNVWEGKIRCYGFPLIALNESLSKAMTEPIRRKLDYAKLGRSIVQVEPLPEGILSYYNDNDKQ
jgi:hypothetical protein